MTPPSSSVKSAAIGSHPSGVRSMLTPVWPAKAISQIVANSPPSERSW